MYFSQRRSIAFHPHQHQHYAEKKACEPCAQLMVRRTSRGTGRDPVLQPVVIHAGWPAVLICRARCDGMKV